MARRPALEWCPPGHGDVYVSLASRACSTALRDEGVDWAFISNADNLGALPTRASRRGPRRRARRS